MAFPRPVKAVVFDMDGLLVDTEAQVLASMRWAAEAHGRDLPFPTFQRMVGLPAAASDLILVEHFGPDFDLDAWRHAMRGHFTAAMAAGAVALKAGVVEILDRLDQLRLPRAIATSSTRVALDHSLGASGVIPRFHAYVTRETVTDHKPHPAPFLAAAAALGVAPADCLALEDSHNGVRAAAAAGMMTVMVPDLLDPTEEMRSLCVRIASDLHEVRGMLG
jgi:HAD superfamily hydrolase (TIGR01509 family)